MKIVHIHQYFNDGFGYQENVLPAYQQKLGHDVIMLTSTLSNNFDNKSIKNKGNYFSNGFRVKRIGVRGEFKNRFVLFNDLYRHLEEERPDYIFHHGATAPSISVAASYKRNHPEVFLALDEHADLNISGRIHLWKLLYYNLFWSRFLRYFDEYIDLYFGVTPARCLFLNEELGISMEKIRLLPIGSDIDSNNSTDDEDLLYEKYNIERKGLLFIHGGKMTPEKDNYKILEAFSNISYDNVQLILFGKIEDRRIEDMIKYDKRIQYIGWLGRRETFNLLRTADLGIWNSMHTTLLEDAVASELPLILRYYGSTSHLIDGTGMFLYEGSVREIQDKLSFILRFPKILEQFKLSGKRISEILSYDNIARESVDYFHDQSPKETHLRFMSKEYSDFCYEKFRKI